ncbi:hypothetical protein PGB90_008823 [Kerria lacca]
MSNVEEDSSGRPMIKIEQDHIHYSDRITDSDRSLSPSDTMTVTNNRNSFCIDALLAKDNRCHSPSTSTNSQNSSRSASISPGSEIQELRSGNSFDELQLPNTMSNRSNILSMNTAAAMLANHGGESNQSNGNFYGLYPVGSSAFQPLPRMDINSRSMNIPGTVTKMLSPVGHSTMTAGHLQQMQLEWFARAGMFYAGPRLQESPGIFGIENFSFLFI